VKDKKLVFNIGDFGACPFVTSHSDVTFWALTKKC